MTGKSRHPADEVIRHFLAESIKPNFEWMWRQRIRVTILNPGIAEGVSSVPSSSSIQTQASLANSGADGLNGNRENDIDGKIEEQHDTDTDDGAGEMSKKSKFRFSQRIFLPLKITRNLQFGR
jgi:hypothetical protein